MKEALEENCKMICCFMDEPYSGGIGKFHCSWEWLMPVLVEIEDQPDVHAISITKDFVIIVCGKKDVFVERQPGDELLDSIYRVVIKYLKV